MLLISLAVMAFVYLMLGLTGSIWLLLVARITAGITAATQSTAMAYIADISRPEDKAVNFGLFGAAFGIGFVLGPLAGGLLGKLGTRAPFFAATLLATLNLIFGYIILPESVPRPCAALFRGTAPIRLVPCARCRRCPGPGCC